MTPEDSTPRGSKVPFPKLPWILAAVFVVLYLATLNPGPGLLTLTTTAKIVDWDWTPTLQYPIYYLLTLPIRVLPDALQVLALNGLSAVLAGLTLALLARSIQILPQDRTKDQRERQRTEHGFLTGPFAWLPPVAAVLVCGLQLLFWQNATNASTEMLDLLVLAWIIRELLEFRIDQNEKRLLRLAFVYGLGVTNNFALIGLFPFTVGALVWIMGIRFFRVSLILKLLAAGVIGLLPYLILPAVVSSSQRVDISFWEALKGYILTQKSMLGIGWNRRLFVLLMCLGSLLPLALIGVRWRSNVGDTSAAGNLLTRATFPLMTLLFVAAALVMNLHLAFAERAQLETGMGFFSLYYLSAIVVGYSIGYLLVVFGKEPMRRHGRPSPLAKLLRQTFLAVAYVVPVAMLVLLLKDNFPQIRDYNRSLLASTTGEMATDLPEAGALVLSDDPIVLNFVRHHLERAGTADQYWMIHAPSLNYPGYHEYLREVIGSAWPEVPENAVFDGNVEDAYIAQLVYRVGQDRPVRYLHPSFGYFFERMYSRPEGHLFVLENFPAGQIQPPEPDPEWIAERAAFLNENWQTQLEALAGQLPKQEASIANQYLARTESRNLNNFGVTLQQLDRFAEATPWFERATQLNTNNASALINLEFNRYHQSDRTNAFTLTESATLALENYRQDLLGVLRAGGQIDTPEFRLLLGAQFSAGKNYRQSIQQYLRALDLAPDNQAARAQIARTFLQAQSPDRALETIREIQAQTATSGLNDLAQIDLISLEAGALMRKRLHDEAIGVLEQGLQKFPDNTIMRDTAVLTYLNNAPYNTNLLANAEPLIANQLQSSPTNLIYRFNDASLHVLRGQWAEGITQLDPILEEAPEYAAARFNRAIALLRTGDLDKARADYEVLLEGAPYDFKLHFGLGDIAEKQNRTADAIEHFETYIRTAPSNTPEYTNIVQRLQQLSSR